MEPRGEAKGNAEWLRMRLTQCRESVTQRLICHRPNFATNGMTVITALLKTSERECASNLLDYRSPHEVAFARFSRYCPWVILGF